MKYLFKSSEENETKSLAVGLGDGEAEFQAEAEPVSGPSSGSQCSHPQVLGPQQVVPRYRVLESLNEIHLYENLSQPGRIKSS